MKNQFIYWVAILCVICGVGTSFSIDRIVGYTKTIEELSQRIDKLEEENKQYKNQQQRLTKLEEYNGEFYTKIEQRISANERKAESILKSSKTMVDILQRISDDHTILRSNNELIFKYFDIK